MSAWSEKPLVLLSKPVGASVTALVWTPVPSSWRVTATPGSLDAGSDDGSLADDDEQATAARLAVSKKPLQAGERFHDDVLLGFRTRRRVDTTHGH